MMEKMKSICGGCGDRGWLEDGSNSCSAVCCTKAALQQHFKHSDFRPGQLEAVLPELHCQDVFVRMATGSGKSLCMFLPPLCVGENAMGIVVSPLNTLMEQQVRCMYCICDCCIPANNYTNAGTATDYSLGVTAVRAGTSNYSDAVAGKFRFGMITKRHNQ